MLGEHKKCQRLDRGLVCSDYDSGSACRSLDIAYHGDMDGYLQTNPTASPDWDCQLRTDSGIYQLDCKLPR